MMSFITAEYAHNPEESTLYRRLPAGEVALFGAALRKKNLNVHAVAAVGQDDLGRFLFRHLEQLGIDVGGISQIDEPTTLLLHNRGSVAENKQAYRGADAQLAIRQFPYARFEDIHWFHTSAFALSKDPARRVIVEACEKAHRAVCRVSLHLNYADCFFWSDRAEAQRVLTSFASNSSLVCLNGPDWRALYGDDATPEAIGDHFLKIGANEVIFSQDNQTWWAFSDKERCMQQWPRPIETETFMAGFLAHSAEDRTLQERLAGSAD